MIPKVIPAVSLLWLLGVCGAVGPTQLKPYNAECAILFPVSETKNCRPMKYYYNSKTGLCGPTCSQDAPFSTRKECELTCRSTLACFIRRQHQRCRGRPRVVVFRFDVYKGKCYAKKSCSYKGNNFPTLKECMSTCGAGAGSTKLSGGDEEGGRSSEQQVREQARLPQLPGQIPGSFAVPIRPELPNIGKPPSILQLPKEKPLLPGVPPTFPDQKPAQPIQNGMQSEVPQVDPRCSVRMSNTTRTCNASKLYFDQNTHLCKATCSNLAPFESRSECNSICRSAVVCFDKSQPQLCKTNTKNIAFYFDALEGKCYARTVCSYRGNNFPSIEECKDTCSRYAGYKSPATVINASSVGPSDIRPSQPANKGEDDKKPPISQPGTRVPPSTGPVLTHLVVRLTSVSDTAIKLLIAQKDPMCRISHLKFAASNCTHHYYYFHQVSRLCKPTCSETAPFAARSACDKICRSAIVCFHQFEEEDCESRHKKTIFFFDPKKGICLKKTGCSNKGNNFPTLQECALTCATYTGSQGTIQVSAAQLNISSGKEPPKQPPKQQATEKPSNSGVVPKVPENVQPVPSDTGTAPALPQQDHRCSITVSNIEVKSCKTYMYYFDSRTHLCNPTCSNAAPFQSRGECVGICRSVLVCFAQRSQNMCNGARGITVYYYNPRKGRCIAGKSCTYIGNNFPTLDECRRTCGAFTGIEEPGEEDSSKVLPEISNKPTKEEPKGPETEHNHSSTTPGPTIPPSGAPFQSGAVATPRPNESVKELPPSIIPAPKPPSTAKPSQKDIVPTIPHRDSRCLIFFPDSTQSYCKARRYYFDIRRRLCMPTCSKWAPFQSSSECTGLCRAVLACFLERRKVPCKTRANFTVFYYDFNSGLCVRGVGCSYSGNNFPTMEECQHTCISIAGVHKPPQVDRGIGVLTAPSSTPSQEHTIQNPPNTPMAPPSLSQKPTQPPAAQQQTNPPNVPPGEPTVNGPQLSVSTASPVQEQATEKQTSIPNTVAPISQKQPPATVLPSIKEQNTKQQTNTNIRWSNTEQSSKGQVNATAPKQPFPSTPQKHKFGISPTVSQSPQQSLQRLRGSSNLPPIPKLITQETSSKATRIDANVKEIPQPARVVSQTQPQITEQRQSTAIAAPPNEQQVTPQQSPSLIDPNQYWTVSQGVDNQMFPMYPRPLPFGFR